MGLIDLEGVINFHGVMYNPLYIIILNGSIQKFESYQVSINKGDVCTDYTKEIHPGVFTVVGVGDLSAASTPEKKISGQIDYNSDQRKKASVWVNVGFSYDMLGNYNGYSSVNSDYIHTKKLVGNSEVNQS